MASNTTELNPAAKEALVKLLAHQVIKDITGAHPTEDRDLNANIFPAWLKVNVSDPAVVLRTFNDWSGDKRVDFLRAAMGKRFGEDKLPDSKTLKNALESADKERAEAAKIISQVIYEISQQDPIVGNKAKAWLKAEHESTKAQKMRDNDPPGRSAPVSLSPDDTAIITAPVVDIPEKKGPMLTKGDRGYLSSLTNAPNPLNKVLKLVKEKQKAGVQGLEPVLEEMMAAIPARHKELDMIEREIAFLTGNRSWASKAKPAAIEGYLGV